ARRKGGFLRSVAFLIKGKEAGGFHRPGAEHAVSGASPAERCRFPAWRPECSTHARARIRRSLSSCRPGPRRSHRTSGRTRAARLLGLRRRHLRGSVSRLTLLRDPPKVLISADPGGRQYCERVWWKVIEHHPRP